MGVSERGEEGGRWGVAIVVGGAGVAGAWWSHNLNILHRKVIGHADRRARQTHTHEDKLASQKMRSTKTTREAKAAYGAKKLEDTDQRSIWKVLKNNRAHQKPTPPIDGEKEFTGPQTPAMQSCAHDKLATSPAYRYARVAASQQGCGDNRAEKERVGTRFI